MIGNPVRFRLSASLRYMRTILPLATLALLLAGCTQPTVPPGHSSSSASSESSASSPLTLNSPQVEIFAKDLSGARVIVRDGFGNFWVSRPKAGVVTVLEIGDDGKVLQQYDAIRNLRNPHGLAFNPAGTHLYVAEETSIKEYLVYSDAPVKTIATLPAGGSHVTRTIEWGPDDRLYVSIGSTCNSCIEKNPLHATIISMNPDGSDHKTVATGLRNSVFFDWSYVDGQMYATEMGRDGLGNDLPPDEINRIKPASSADSAAPSYGWPYCFGDRIRDSHVAGDVDCATTEPPHIALPAHVAPLGLAFIPEEGWPEAWWYDLLVAEHGSTQIGSVKVGYKVVRIPLDANGNPEGEPVDFLTGFLEGETVRGRPVDIMVEPGGTMYVTDDKEGVVWRVGVGEEM